MIIYGNTLMWAALLAINVVALVLTTGEDEISVASITFTTLICALCSWKLRFWIQRGIEDFKEDNP